MISLTERGRAVIESALPDVSSKVSAAYEGFSDTEMQQFAAMYERLMHNLNSAE